MKNILVLNPVPYTSETGNIKKIKSLDDTMIVSLCDALAKQNKVTLYLCEEFKPIFQKKYSFEIIYDKAIFKKIFLPNKLPYLKHLKKFLIMNKDYFDLIICSEAFSFCTYYSCKICPNKTIIWQEIAKHYSLFHGLLSKLYFSKIFKKKFSNVLVCARSEKAKQFISQFSNNVSNVIIEHGINISSIPFSSKKENYFVIVSQLIERKNLFYSIDEFGNYLKKYDKKCKLFICGDGELKEKIEKYIASCSLSENVILLGKKSHAELFLLMSKAIGLLVSTKQDNNMVSIIESIACGTPILTNSVPYNSEYISKFNLGIVKDNWNYNDIYEIYRNNLFFSSNCIKFRNVLDNEYKANLFCQLAFKGDK